jgi:hypothetical protein
MHAMKEVEKKDAPEVSGGYVGPLVEDPSVAPPFPQNPTVPVQPGQTEDLPQWR